MEKLHIKSAVKGKSKIDLSCSHLTTLNFGQIMPIYNLECIPGDKITVDTSIFSRCAPLYVPTYGKASLKTAGFYVPYHQVAEDAEAYFAGKTSWMGQTPVLRHTTLGDLFYVFYNVSTVVAPEDDYDWTYIEEDGTTVNHMQFTATGKYYYKVLRSLGYQIPEGVNLSSGSTWLTTISRIKVNVYPFLCFCKAYNDYMSQSARYNSSILSTCLLNIRQNKAYTIPGTSSTYTTSGCLNSNMITSMLGQILLCYENDMFTSAWQSPNAALSSMESVTDVAVTVGSTPAAANNRVSANTNYSEFTTVSDRVTQRALDFLRSFDDWVRRNNYSGSRDVQQIYSRFGIKSDDYRTHYAHCLGQKNIPLQVGDVTAVAQSEGTPLGDYAGKGIISGDNKVNVDASDFGQLIILAWIAVRPMYPNGFDYSVLKNSPLDFYNPEFDGIGPRAISMNELDVNAKEGFTDGQSVFGFTERYNEYRYPKDKITGDMCLSSDYDCWHFGRDLSALRTMETLVAQNPSFVQQYPGVNSEFDRIFNAPSTADVYEDKFYLTCHFGVSAFRPILNLNGVADLGNGDVTMEKNGNEMC